MLRVNCTKQLFILLVVTSCCYAHGDIGAAAIGAAMLGQIVFLLSLSIASLVLVFTHKKAQRKETQILAFIAICVSAFFIIKPMFYELELALVLGGVQGVMVIIAAIIFVRSPQPINLGILLWGGAVAAVLAIAGPLLFEQWQLHTLKKQKKQSIENSITILRNTTSTVESRQKSFEQLIKLSRQNIDEYTVTIQVDRIDYSDTFLRDLKILGDTHLYLPFSDCSFRKAQMQNCDIRGGLYNNTDFTEANISGGHLHGNMEKAKFVKANLVNISLAGEIVDADFSQADLSGAHLKGVFDSCLFVDTKLNKVKLPGVVIAHGYFKNSDASGADLSSAKGYFVKFENVNLSKTSLKDSELPGASFDNVNLCDANLQNAHFLDSKFLKELTEYPSESKRFGRILSKEELAKHEKKITTWIEEHRSEFKNSDLTGADFSGANLQYADFTGAKMDNANMKGANLTNAIITPEQIKKCLNIAQAIGVEKMK